MIESVLSKSGRLVHTHCIIDIPVRPETAKVHLLVTSHKQLQEQLKMLQLLSRLKVKVVITDGKASYWKAELPQIWRPLDILSVLRDGRKKHQKTFKERGLISWQGNWLEIIGRN